jgi:hypothetical protein
MSERLRTLSHGEARGVCGAVVLARSIGADALSQLESVLAESGLPQPGLSAAIDRGVKLSRESGIASLTGFLSDLQALGCSLADDANMYGLLQEWRSALRGRAVLSVERLALGHLGKFVKGPSSGTSFDSEHSECVIDQAPQVHADAENRFDPAQAKTKSVPGEFSVPPALVAPIQVEQAMGVTDLACSTDRLSTFESFNRRFAADLGMGESEQIVLTLPT